MTIKYKIKSVDEERGHMVIQMFNEHMKYEYNLEIPYPLPSTEEELHSFIHCNIPFIAFERIERVVKNKPNFSFIKSQMNHEFTVANRVPTYKEAAAPVVNQPAPLQTPQVALEQLSKKEVILPS